MIDDIKLQSDTVQGMLEQRVYSIVGELSHHGINAERFDRINDFTKEVSVVPTSGFTGEGIPELLMVLSGLAQRYLEKDLEVNLSKPGGSVPK
jgi:translation initiation factor 5B